jgi:hypothetical protein
MASKTIWGVTPTVYADLKCKREGCTGRVMEDEIYYENGKAYQDLVCLLCAEHYYLTTTEWAKQKKKIEAVVLKRKRERYEQSLIESGDSEVLPSS